MGCGLYLASGVKATSFKQQACDNLAIDFRNKFYKMQRMKEITVKKKTVYGNDLIYPVCDDSKLFARISGHKTLLPEVISCIKQLGYKLKTKSEEI